jgi:hypothetical protein
MSNYLTQLIECYLLQNVKAYAIIVNMTKKPESQPKSISEHDKRNHRLMIAGGVTATAALVAVVVGGASSESKATNTVTPIASPETNSVNLANVEANVAGQINAGDLTNFVIGTLKFSTPNTASGQDTTTITQTGAIENPLIYVNIPEAQNLDSVDDLSEVYFGSAQYDVTAHKYDVTFKRFDPQTETLDIDMLPMPIEQASILKSYPDVHGIVPNQGVASAGNYYAISEELDSETNRTFHELVTTTNPNIAGSLEVGYVENFQK